MFNIYFIFNYVYLCILGVVSAAECRYLQKPTMSGGFLLLDVGAREWARMLVKAVCAMSHFFSLKIPISNFIFNYLLNI